MRYSLLLSAALLPLAVAAQAQEAAAPQGESEDSPIIVTAARDATAAPRAVRANNGLYPLHAARMEGSAFALPLRIVMTLAGLGLTLLGSLAVVTFWRSRKLPAIPRAKRLPAAPREGETSA